MGAQCLEKPKLAFAFAFFPQPLKRVFHNRRRPSEVEDALRRQGVECLNRDGQLRRRFGHPIVPGNKFHAAAAFVGMSFLRGVDQTMLERPIQERTEPPAVTIGVLQPIVLQNGHKKILSEVLCILNRIAACTHKRENGPPICPAKLGQRVASFLLFVGHVGGRKNQAPAGGYKLMRSACTLVAVLPVHERTLWFLRFHTSTKQSAEPCVGAVFFMRYEISSLQAGIDFAATKTVLGPAE